MERKEQILTLLRSFIGQRPGFEPGNYSDWSSYRSEMRSVTQDRHDAEELLHAVEWRSSITAEALTEAFRAFSGRLTLTETPEGKLRLDYCTGQYFPTEYRKAVCSVLSQALWDHTRNHCMPTPETMHNSETGETVERYKGKRAGDYLRDTMRQQFGRRLARRYFD